MLQTQKVNPELFKLLKRWMDQEMFSSFHLVEGTSLALQIVHRNSIDIELFGNSKF